MVERTRIVRAVHRAIDAVNEQLPAEGRIDNAPDTILYGQMGTLDSLAFVNLILATEECLEDEFGVSVALADGADAGQDSNPFRTVASLVEHIAARLEGKVSA